MKRVIIFVLIFSFVFSFSLWAKSDFMKKFDGDYDLIDVDLLTNEGEEFTVADFVYQKDAATFTFKKGVIHLLRYVDGRPTTALFSGEGNVKINIPTQAERMSLMRFAATVWLMRTLSIASSVSPISLMKNCANSSNRSSKN